MESCYSSSYLFVLLCLARERTPRPISDEDYLSGYSAAGTRDALAPWRLLCDCPSDPEEREARGEREGEERRASLNCVGRSVWRERERGRDTYKESEGIREDASRCP